MWQKNLYINICLLRRQFLKRKKRKSFAESVRQRKQKDSSSWQSSRHRRAVQITAQAAVRQAPQVQVAVRQVIQVQAAQALAPAAGIRATQVQAQVPAAPEARAQVTQVPAAQAVPEVRVQVLQAQVPAALRKAIRRLQGMVLVQQSRLMLVNLSEILMCGVVPV